MGINLDIKIIFEDKLGDVTHTLTTHYHNNIKSLVCGLSGYYQNIFLASECHVIQHFLFLIHQESRKHSECKKEELSKEKRNKMFVKMRFCIIIQIDPAPKAEANK
ncbi:CLUMA_CG006630, isoform A [Clunio marinus]|uniref:CLUMA_CG006630, isoform A n=1 Tax=Clunio marinus TaxID=568069 RepID=A0A1J1HYH5_9DIPT|nr:CLUMA_CG006630, isoform A [Clunio marinus]